MPTLVVTGTNTDIGKTVVTAAVAAIARAKGQRVAVLKPAQTGVAPGEEGDAHVAARLAGEGVDAFELARFPEPLAPATSARRAGLRPVTPQDAADAARELEAAYDLVLVEGAGGLLVRMDGDGGTLADVAGLLDAPVLVVAAPALGTLNLVQLTGDALRARGLTTRGVVIGAWPHEPGLAERCNVEELAEMAGAPLLGAVPAGAGALDPVRFAAEAGSWLARELGGGWDAAEFAAALR
ncbi:dethiobiotin synthase [Streptomyces sp. NBC_00237]|uniref:dethiobiotin synthase n=1 Tax=Streptomyces sp. NBC_00237 TaxID=2975687 RepID=UPI0022581B3C|nr:dethiobiotin synthase [Streptomyces sp. NBC_00237]MCX5206978.1 dethiobiotin synthase [Streptomyces sp. NBC_00237]